MKRYEEMKGDVNVKLQGVSYGDLANKLASTVNAGNPPDLVEGGTNTLALFQQGEVPNHGSYIQEKAGYVDDMTPSNITSAKYRNEWWSGGGNRMGNTMMDLNVDMFKQGAGIQDPETELETWTDFRRAVEKVDEQYDVPAYEVTGTPSDLEMYWGIARTAYTDGEDPWIDVEDQGSPDTPYVKIGKKDRTDGMIKDVVNMAKTFSSSEAASRADEETPALMLTDRIGSTYGLIEYSRYTTVDKNVKFGWEGDIATIPLPRLDPNYGSEFDIPELANKEGEHGGHTWPDLVQKSILDTDKKEEAFDLLVYTNTNENHMLPYIGEMKPSMAMFSSVSQKLLEQYGDEHPPYFRKFVEAVQSNPPQFQGAGSTWDINGTNEIRSEDLNQTISQAIAGQHPVEQTPSIIRERVLETLDQN
jgi:ABC-type glycerol-3-phosphate transport system substrate-binding protein